MIYRPWQAMERDRLTMVIAARLIARAAAPARPGYVTGPAGAFLALRVARSIDGCHEPWSG
ncbi:hypothetical protein [Verrucosispora sp. WMMD573]|uniref:hypothetical protein n=1 Tax=Verrucosispora sp. WMMD573 TaxID=3015149 RepID=UPI00248C3EFF|nr:hypothetical protein [Verrucosispora sp. WMMD573]WBB53889.1 hypothetical protein O7601_25555 [Verrucosispora sp. WMMD573]